MSNMRHFDLNGLKLLSLLVTIFVIQMALAIEDIQTDAQRKPGEFCINPAGEPGKCISIRECEPLLNVLLRKAHVSAIERAFVLKSKCSMHKRQPWVCCAGPPPDAQNPLPSPPNCGVRSETRLIGGQLTQLDGYPWTTLIEYEKPDGSTDFHCGGTLINQGHILTAAHCVSSLPAGWKLHGVRLGEWDLSQKLDCEYNYCNNPPIDMKVAKILVHDRYDALNGSFHHDIAILRLEGLVNFSDTIQPICLPLAASIRKENLTDGFSTIVGWGKTLTSPGVAKKLLVDLRERNFHDCISLLERQKEVQTPHLCAIGERSKNEICSADAGAGLQRFFYGFQYLIGVAGHGEHKCGTVDVPGVFINVVDYIEWIQDKVK